MGAVGSVEGDPPPHTHESFALLDEGAFAACSRCAAQVKPMCGRQVLCATVVCIRSCSGMHIACQPLEKLSLQAT